MAVELDRYTCVRCGQLTSFNKVEVHDRACVGSPNSKRCSVCLKVKEVDEFYNDPRGYLGVEQQISWMLYLW